MSTSDTAPLTLRSIPWSRLPGADPSPLLTREWIVANGLGGYASGTLSGIATRRYHGLLIAALPEPRGRTLFWNQLSERVTTPEGRRIRFGGSEQLGRLDIPVARRISSFRLEDGLPVWEFRLGQHQIERRLFMPHRQNTVHLIYRLIEGPGPMRLALRPGFNFRGHDAPVSTPLVGQYGVECCDDRFEIKSGDSEMPRLRFRVWDDRTHYLHAPRLAPDLHYRIEAQRGYDQTGALWSPGAFLATLDSDNPVRLTASVEPWSTILAMEPEEALEAETARRRRLVETADPRARTGPAAELVLSADAFLITPAGRREEAARALAHGDEVRTVIAGYHWFTDWGRDTMISLEGLTLATGRHREAAYILRTFADAIRDGLVPNLFPEGQSQGLYHTADATLWFFQALHRYHRATGDADTVRHLIPRLLDVVDHHRRGTHFGIGVDPSDGLLRQGAEGYQLTWMDAKVDGWVVTPRRGKTVEINALWYNALCLLGHWCRTYGSPQEAERLEAEARIVHASFNGRFWSDRLGYLLDLVDGDHGDDPACRPNQLFAISLDHPVLDPRHWAAVLDVARRQLLTPVGLRSLAPGHPDYKQAYDGDLRSRDAAYHQGTVWSWLIGPYIDAFLKVYPDRRGEARECLRGLVEHLNEAGLGTISEIFDAEPPFAPRGCMAQAWGVAEALRCWIATTPGAGSNGSV